jgi:DNA polymerase III delta prime subunit
MLPKIIVCKDVDPNWVRDKAAIRIEKEIGFDGSDAKVKEFRGWLTFAINLVSQEDEMSLVIWKADKLGKDCQNALLKPLEEKPTDAKYLLVVSSEYGLLPTIVSRCQVSFLEGDQEEGKYWSEVVKCWRGGPGGCVAFAEKIKSAEVVAEVLNEVVSRVGSETRKSVNQKRVQIMKLALSSLQNLVDSNVNPRLFL